MIDKLQWESRPKVSKNDFSFDIAMASTANFRRYVNHLRLFIVVICALDNSWAAAAALDGEDEKYIKIIFEYNFKQSER